MIPQYLDRFPIGSLMLTSWWKTISKEHEGDVWKWFLGIRELDLGAGLLGSGSIFFLDSSLLSARWRLLYIRLGCLEFRLEDFQPFTHSHFLHIFVVSIFQ